MADSLATSVHRFTEVAQMVAQPDAGGTHHHVVDRDAEVMARFDYLPDGFGINAELFPTIRGHALKPHLTNQPGKPHGILDIDSGTRQTPGAVAASFNVDAVMTALGHHKDRISAMFRAAVTSVALDDWGLS